jgi:hypothetical protein
VSTSQQHFCLFTVPVFRPCAIRAPLVPNYLFVRIVWCTKEELLEAQVLLVTGYLATELTAAVF